MRMRFACSLWQRLRGLKPMPGYGGVLVLAPCRDIHTFGMARPIDVAFVSARGEVLEAHYGVPPGRRLRCPGAALVLERYSSERPWPGTGDALRLRAVPVGGEDDSEKGEGK